MFLQLRNAQAKVAVLLTFLLVVSLFSSIGIPTASALVEGVSGGGITLTGYDSTEGKSSKPYINYESSITLTGNYASTINGENLRLKILTNNGKSIEDLSSTKPAVDLQTRTFRFRDVALKPGMNQIVFYETNGSVTSELLSFYVQYNNTPVLSELEVESVDLVTDPTVIRLTSSNIKDVTLTGKAVNANSVKVINSTTGKEFVDDVNQSGSFAVDVDVILGVNKFSIVAYNSTRQVEMKERSIVVTVTGGVQGESDQFYGVSFKDDNTGSNAKQLEAGKTINYSPATKPTKIDITGSALIYAPSTIEILKQLNSNVSQNHLAKVITLYEINPVGAKNEVGTGGDLASMPTMKSLSGDYKQFDVSSSINYSDWKDGYLYEVEMSYMYIKSVTSNGNTTKTNEGPAKVKNYSYKFTYLDNNSPRIESLINSKEKKNLILGTDVVNSVRVSPLVIDITGANIAAVDLYLNDSTVALGNSEYSYSDNTITLTTLPQGKTKVKLVGYNSTDKTNPLTKKTSVEFVMMPEVAPFVELSYLDDSNNRKFIDSTLEISDLNALKDIDVKVTNYTWSSSDDKIYVNGTANANIVQQSSPNNTYSTLIDADDLKDKLKSGSNTLKVVLAKAPNATYTYTIFYSNQTLPSLSNVSFKVEQNKKDVELDKLSSGNSYETSAFFLSEFSFSVDKAKNVQVLKDGNVIASYEFTNGKWTYKTADVKDALEKAAGSNSDLKNVFEKRNFPDDESSSQKRTFTANMTSRQYGNELLDELESMNLAGQDLEDRLELFPLTLNKGGTTSYEIVISDGNVASRHKYTIKQTSGSWEVLSPVKKDNEPYAQVNTNNVRVRIFAENATKVLFGKTEAVAYNTDKPDFEYNEELGKSLPESYYVFEANVALKAGLNKVKFSVVVGDQTYTDEIQIYNVNSTVSGAESRDILGKKLSFSVFDKALELKFPKGTVLLAPSVEREGNDVRPPATDIYTDVPLYFGIADRTTGRVNLDDSSTRSDMEDILELTSEFNYASPLYYIDAGNAEAGGDEDERQPGGRDPYFEGEMNGKTMETFIERWENNLVPSKAGTLTIQYNPSIVNAANNTMAVFFNNGDEWTNLGGVVNTSKKTITVPFKGFGYYMVMKTRETFTDVIFHDFARDAIETLYAKGIMNDAPGTGFGTELKISRGEFATMLVKALGLPINAGPYEGNDEDDPISPTFRDVRPSGDIEWKYQYKYIETAARAGIVRGKDTSAFFPDDSLTREEAAIMIARALNLKLTGSAEAAQANLKKMFTDGKDIGIYSAPSVLAVTKAKIMNGEPNDASAAKPTYKFAPKNDLTRAEMAVITVRIMVQLKKLPKQ